MLDDATRYQDFPLLREQIYLNTAAEGIPPLAVGNALEQYFRDHQLGMDGRELHEAQRDAVKVLTAQMYGLTSDEIGIASCSSEAYNLAAMALQLQAGDEIVINDLDFPAGATPWLQPSSPASVKVWRSREGALRVDDLIPLLTPHTRLVQVSLVSFYNGFKAPLAAIIEAVRRHSAALISVDVTQALGRIPLKLDDVDLIISSTHKWILATHGGALIGLPAQRAQDWTVPAGGWFNLQDAFGPDRFEMAVSQPGAASFSVGMPNYPALYAIRAALEYIQQVGVAAIDDAGRPLLRLCLEGVARLPVELLTPTEDEALAGIIAFRHPNADAIHHYLHDANIHIMAHAGRLRISIHGYNTQADVEQMLQKLDEALHHAV